MHCVSIMSVVRTDFVQCCFAAAEYRDENNNKFWV
jgi:hypothetical protein